jgi:hypothetical protein
MNRYFSFGLKALFLPGFHGNQAEKQEAMASVPSTPLVTDFRGVEGFRLIAPCSLTLIYCSLINRLTLAAAFAAAFFMPVENIEAHVLQKIPRPLSDSSFCAEEICTPIVLPRETSLKSTPYCLPHSKNL